MIQLTVITTGTLKEAYWRDALAEYEKRLGAFCKTNIIQLKEHKLSENPSQDKRGSPFRNIYPPPSE